MKKVSFKNLINYLKEVKPVCGTEIAIGLLNDPNHPIAKIESKDFTLRKIFELIEIDVQPSDNDGGS